MEENVGLGGFGDTVCQYADDSQLDVKVLNIALPDDYVEHGNVSILKKEEGIDAAGVADRVLSFYTNIQRKKIWQKKYRQEMVLLH